MKPRSAILDAEILELFNKINKVNTSSNGLLLPYYKIRSCNNKYSIWDFIDGDLVSTITEHQDPSSTASSTEWKGFTPTKKKNIKRMENIEYLNTVSRMIGLTDLHTDNVILNENMYYPIDLEVVDKKSVTGLYGFTKDGNINKSLLNREALDLIENFNENINDLPNRFLPLSTVKLTRYINNDGVFIDELIEIFTKNKRVNNIKLRRLRNYLIDCKKKRIIPYFIIYNNKEDIFYYDFNDHEFLKLSIPDCNKIQKKKTCKRSSRCKWNKRSKRCRPHNLNM
jgi:hypothetical protein